jgi:hypothetical protein
MGRSKKTPPPPKLKKVAPPTEEIDPEYIAMFLRDRMRSKKSAYLTRGQRMDALAKAKAATPRRSASEAKDIKTRKKDVFKKFDPVEKGEKAETVTPVKKSGRNPRSVVTGGDDYKPLEERAKFLSKQQGDVTPLKSGEEFDKKNYKLYEKGTANRGQQRRVADSKKRYKEYLQGYIDKTTKQLEKEYTTTQLRNLGIK